jgi:hypothetical protein
MWIIKLDNLEKNFGTQKIDFFIVNMICESMFSGIFGYVKLSKKVSDQNSALLSLIFKDPHTGDPEI